VPDAEPEPSWRIARFVFLRALGVSLWFGFLALLNQAPGLIGSRGITPLPEILAAWTRSCGAAAIWNAPSLFWLSSADGMVTAVAGLGLVASTLLILGVASRWACFVCWVCWLSFRAIDGGPVCWFNYPYDHLQTEVAFLGIFVAPATLSPLRPPPPLPRWVRWLCYWLAFRVMFGPGIMKVMTQPSWLDLSAVGDFLLTMPHPTAAAAWFLDLPKVVLQALTAFTLLCELVCPFLLLVPGWPRRVAAALCIVLMVGIQAVCNIRGFNVLTAGLLMLSWDDAALLRLVPASWRARFAAIAVQEPPPPNRWRTAAACTVVALSVGASIGPNAALVGCPLASASPAAAAVDRALAPFGFAGAYAMFYIVPPERFVLVVQGSDDGETWRDEQPPGPSAQLDHRPTFFAPYHDYLGFKLWFAAFCPPEQDGWLAVLQQRLLAGEPSVARLFVDPQPGSTPPRFVRVAAYRYRHTTADLRAQGVFWQRELLGIRLPSRSRSG
jgi:uncharacterized membrane protein YphA (DoxX/SURF4 family)